MNIVRYALLDPEGYPVRFGQAGSVPNGFTALPEGTSLQDAPLLHLVDGIWVYRPALTAPVIAPVPGTGVSITWTDLPALTQATVIDAQIGAELATLSEVLGQIHIILPDTGAYVIELTPPRPYLPMTVEIEVPA